MVVHALETRPQYIAVKEIDIATDLTNPMIQTLKRMPAAGWVHAKQLSNYSSANVTTVRSLAKRGLLQERAAEGYLQLAVHITEAGLAARPAAA